MAFQFIPLFKAAWEMRYLMSVTVPFLLILLPM